MRRLRISSTPKQKLRRDCQKSATSVMHLEISAWRQKLLLAAVECLSLAVAWEKFIKSHKAVSQTWLIALWLALTDNHRLVMQCHPLSPPSNGWDRRWERGVLIAAVIFNKDKLFACIPPLHFPAVRHANLSAGRLLDVWAPFLTHSIPPTCQQAGQARAKSHDECVRARRAEKTRVCVTTFTNMNMLSWRPSLYRCALYLRVRSGECPPHICVFEAAMRVRERLSVCVHV